MKMIRSNSFVRLGEYPTPALGETPALSYDPPSSTNTVLSAPSFLEFTANQSLHSSAYSMLYLFTIMLNIVIVTWTVCVAWNKETPTTVLFMEMFINTVLALEIVFRSIVLKKAFLQSPSNLFDIVVVIFCYFSMFVLWYQPVNGQKDDIPALMLRLFRDVVRLFRLIYLIRKWVMIFSFV
eukprot:TRINITY_DN825_c0_g1_i8.p1 TRINITY_DN825_c0_g1~~TRINITY_DN825_c0_g1_i8.p1  ORF type:complete len:181 (-),score=37.26 TRINITY_DN825_c0_g1_i8:823-1365(-)